MPDRTPFITAIILICFFNSGCTNKCPDTTAISTGEFSGNWLYENKELGLRIQLPRSWYMYTYVGHNPYPVQMDSVMPDGLILTKSVQLKDMEKGREPAPVKAIFNIREESREDSPSCSLLLMASENQDETGDIELLKTFGRSLGNNNPNKDLRNATVPIKNGTLKGLSFDIMLRDEYLATRLMLIRNYGCYNLAIIANYNTDEQFEKIKSILATASISKP